LWYECEEVKKKLGKAKGFICAVIVEWRYMEFGRLFMYAE